MELERLHGDEEARYHLCEKQECQSDLRSHTQPVSVHMYRHRSGRKANQNIDVAIDELKQGVILCTDEERYGQRMDAHSNSAR